ncbi:CHAP domain-containing protein [Nocardioides sp. KR10-350]|uniref:CHAP domain-containing protein n=1 Tax=Nocardioides cheoyonin TaxID=3156615 RepID=UPI0032B47F11
MFVARGPNILGFVPHLGLGWITLCLAQDTAPERRHCQFRGMNMGTTNRNVGLRLARTPITVAAIVAALVLAVLAPLAVGSASPASAASTSSIGSIAAANVGNGPCSKNSAGGTGYYTSCNGESWCSDFAKWVWAQAGFPVAGITASSGTFITAASQNGSTIHTSSTYAPKVGDAIVFNYNSSTGWADHVGLVAAVNSDGSIDAIHGNINGVVYRINSVPASQARVGAAMTAGGLVVGNGATPHVSAFVSPKGSSATVTDGSFVSYGGDVYRIAGGAPIYVSSWKVFGGSKPTTALTASQWKSLRSTPKNGTFITGKPSNRVYVMAGGAPEYVSNWKNVGGQKPTIAVDDSAISHASGSGKYSHLRTTPTNGTYITAGGRSYVIAGGAPLYIWNWANVGGQKSTVRIDQWAVQHAGGTGLAKHLRSLPYDGTFISGYKSGRVYRIVNGGHPYYVSSWKPYSGPLPTVQVDDTAITGCYRMNCSPFGHVDGVTGGKGTIRVRGWAMDPNTTSPVKILYYFDGKKVRTVTASKTRTDVDRAYHRGARFGFDNTTAAKAGKHKVCTHAVNVGVGSNVLLNCTYVTVK